MDAHLEAMQQRAPGVAARTLAPEAAVAVLQMASDPQNTSSANFASRTLLEYERLLREGGVSPKDAMARALSRSQSQTSLRLSAWAS